MGWAVALEGAADSPAADAPPADSPAADSSAADSPAADLPAALLEERLEAWALLARWETLAALCKGPEARLGGNEGAGSSSCSRGISKHSPACCELDLQHGAVRMPPIIDQGLFLSCKAESVHKVLSQEQLSRYEGTYCCISRKKVLADPLGKNFRIELAANYERLYQP